MRNSNDRLKRACDLIKSDRIGVSTGIEKTVSREVALTLSDFFALSSEPEIQISATETGFEITVKATAKSVKYFRSVN